MNFLTRLTTPSALIKNGFLIRKLGLFYRESIRLKDIARVIAINKDAFTHDETVIYFEDCMKSKVYLSEFDRGYDAVIKQLGDLLPGFQTPPPILVKKPFEKTRLVLWIKPLT